MRSPPAVSRPSLIRSRRLVSPALTSSWRFWKAWYISFQRARETRSPRWLKYMRPPPYQCAGNMDAKTSLRKGGEKDNFTLSKVARARLSRSRVAGDPRHSARELDDVERLHEYSGDRNLQRLTLHRRISC